MLTDLRRALEHEPDVAYALLFGSGARGTLTPTSDVDVALELRPGAPRDVQTRGRLLARLEAAVGRPVDLVLLDEAPSPLAYRIFREGRLVVERDHDGLARRKARAILEYLDFKPVEDLCVAGVLRAAPAVVDRLRLARQIASVRNAVARIRAVLPPSAEAFAADRTAREVVVLNLFVGIQACVNLAAHWLADEGWDVPQRYGEIFLALADHDVIPRPLALRLVAAAGLRNLVAHQYGALEWGRLHALAASPELDDLEVFCAALASRVR